MRAPSDTTISNLSSLLARFLRALESRWWAWALLAFGVVIRIREYLLNNALFDDEAALGLNVINRPFSALFGKLDANQVAPAGFLVLEKCAVTLFGTTEYSLRLVPLLFSLVSLYLFYEVARRYLSGGALLFALGLFVGSGYLVHYGAQVKQYTGDVAVALAITLLALELNRELTTKTLALFAVLGVLAVWLSHPSVFVLAGVGSTLCVTAAMRRDWQRTVKLAAACFCWLVSFGVFFAFSLSRVSANAMLEKSWDAKGTFMPLPPHSLSDLRWFPATLLRFFTNPLTSPFPYVAVAALILGLYALYRANREYLLFLAAPVLFNLLASGLHKYPFGRRLVLYLVPAVILTIASGVELLLKSNWGLQVTGMALAAFLALKPIGGAASHARWGPSTRDIRNIMTYVKDQRSPGDLTYFYHGQRNAFQYYAPRIGFNEGEYLLGGDPPEKVKGAGVLDNDKTDLERLRGVGRVWLVFSNVRTYKGVNEEEFMCAYVEGFGQRIEQHKRNGIAAYLYDTTPK